MADLCPTCGIRLDDGLCQCPEVLLREVERLRAKTYGYRAALWLCMDDIGGFLHSDGSPFIRGSGDMPNNFASIYAQCEAGKEPRLSVLVSDTFAYACADSEDVAYPQAAALLAIARDEGWPGIIRWVQEQRRTRGEEAKPLAEVARSMSLTDGLRRRAEDAEATIRSLRAKLMRERANTHEWVASMVDDGYIAATEQTEAKSRSYHARARRLRAEADRIDGGGR